jgi:hypothetical protein
VKESDIAVGAVKEPDIAVGAVKETLNNIWILIL